jgi:hypothetical protein
VTKKVVWTSCTRLACACATPPPPVILCLTSSDLLAPIACPNPDVAMSYAFTTLAATLTKSWKSSDACQNPSWSYVFEYDETLLATPTVALTAAQISGAFCEGCITTWVRDEVGDEIAVDINADEQTVTITSQHGCATAFSISGGDPTIDWHTTGNTGTVDGTDFCGTKDAVPFTVRANNLRARYTDPNTYASTTGGSIDAPNILDGSSINVVTNAVAATVTGGAKYAQSNKANKILGTGLTPTTIAFGSTVGGGA